MEVRRESTHLYQHTEFKNDYSETKYIIRKTRTYTGFTCYASMVLGLGDGCNDWLTKKYVGRWRLEF